MSGSNNIAVTVGSGDSLDVRSFSLKQGLSQLFQVDMLAMSANADIDFDDVIGKAATFTLTTPFTRVSWEGVCSAVELVRAESTGLSTYTLVVVPKAWLMTQRKNYRIFQMKSELDIVKQMLGEWGVAFEARVDGANHKPRKYRVQYDESDFAFVSRMLEDAGITYFFETKEGASTMVLDDAPQSKGLSRPPLDFYDEPDNAGEFVTKAAVSQRVRPGKMTVGDLDYRKPSDAQPQFSALLGLAQESNLEQFVYEPGAFLYKTMNGGGNTPAADDRGASRTDNDMGKSKTAARLAGKRQSAKRGSFESNALDVIPGAIISVLSHPNRLFADGNTLLVTAGVIAGVHDEMWRVNAEVVPTSVPYAPERNTPRPWVKGLESATVVGPAGEEIHTDEYGRVRVHFHWDRAGARDETASCWIPSSNPWAGAGFGGVNLPRIGQEVLVEFLGGDPDRPVVVGRVYTETQGAPYKLPKYKNVTGIRSETTPGLLMGAADGGTVTTQDSPLGGGKPRTDQEMHDRVTTDGPFKAASPNKQAHQWKGSEFMIDDTRGQEIAYIQAQRDLNMVVKNSWTSVVGNYRATDIGTDDLLNVVNKQDIKIGSDQTIRVTGNQTTTIVKEQTTDVTEGIRTTAKKLITVKSDEQILLCINTDSFISITAEGIVIQSPRIDLNPAPTPEERAEKAEEDRKAAEKAEFLKAALAAVQAYADAGSPNEPGNPIAKEAQAADAAKEAGDPKGEAYHNLSAAIMNGENSSTLSDQSRDQYRQQLMDGWYGDKLSGADADSVLDAYAKGTPP